MNFGRLNAVMNWHRRVGTIFGIPIHLHITILFFLWPALSRSGLAFGYGVEYAILIVLSILAHELGHALTAKHFKQGGLLIMLHGFGGFASSQGNRSPRQELLIVLAGPAVTFAIGIICLLVGNVGLQSQSASEGALVQFAILHALGRLEILMGFLNMIPCFPWDGGLALAAVLSHRMPEFKANRIACHLGLILGPTLAIYGLINRADFFLLFGLMGGLSSFAYLKNTGGIRFQEPFDDRKARKEEEAFRKRQREKQAAYLDEVSDRARQREEDERLRKLFE